MNSSQLPAFPTVLRPHANRRTYGPGTTIFRAGSATRWVYYLVSGCVRLIRRGRAGEEIVLHQAQAGEFFAEASIDSARYTFTEQICQDSLSSKRQSPATFRSYTASWRAEQSCTIEPPKPSSSQRRMIGLTLNSPTMARMRRLDIEYQAAAPQDRNLSRSVSGSNGRRACANNGPKPPIFNSGRCPDSSGAQNPR
jgi:hypothetical protein